MADRSPYMVPIILSVLLSMPTTGQAEDDLKQAYQRSESMIPMRDGVRLYTQIYTPKHLTSKLPILFLRSPYGISGEDGGFTRHFGTSFTRQRGLRHCGARRSRTRFPYDQIDCYELFLDLAPMSNMNREYLHNVSPTLGNLMRRLKTTTTRPNNASISLASIRRISFSP